MKQKASLLKPIAPPSHLAPLMADPPVVHDEDISEEHVIPESPSPESMDVVQVPYMLRTLII